MTPIIIGFALLGLTGGAPDRTAAASPPAQAIEYYRYDYDECGPRCRERRYEAERRARWREHERREAHERWEHQQRGS